MKLQTQKWLHLRLKNEYKTKKYNKAKWSTFFISCIWYKKNHFSFENTVAKWSMNECGQQNMPILYNYA